MTTSPILPARCTRCLGAGRLASMVVDSNDGAVEPVACDGCNGFGWRWSDGIKPTLCPGGGTNPIVNEPTSVPCGRQGATCPGCDRERVFIGNDEDQRRTFERKAGA